MARGGEGDKSELNFMMDASWEAKGDIIGVPTVAQCVKNFPITDDNKCNVFKWQWSAAKQQISNAYNPAETTDGKIALNTTITSTDGATWANKNNDKTKNYGKYLSLADSASTEKSGKTTYMWE